MKTFLRHAILIAIITLAILAVVFTYFFATRAKATAHVGCAPTAITRPTSLHAWEMKTGLSPSMEIQIAVRCDGLHGGLTLPLANLLDGDYGARIDYANLPTVIHYRDVFGHKKSVHTVLYQAATLG